MIGLAVSAAFPAAADILTVVDLTREQTLALYGTSIQGKYYTGSEWKTCTFEYFDPPHVDASPWITHIRDTYNTGYTDQQIDSLLRSNEFIFYRCAIGDLVPPPVSSGHMIQFDLNFSVSIDGIAYFRQIVGMGTGERLASGSVSSSLRPWADDFYVSSSVSYAPVPVVSAGRGAYQNELTAWFSCSLGWDSDPLYVGGSHIFDNIGKFFFSDVYLQDIDSETGQENTFSLSGQQFVFNYAQTYTLPVHVDSYTAENVRAYYVIALSTPRVTDGYIFPDIPTTAPNYSEQLDDIISQGAANNTLLQQILAKLDLIYQRMQQQGYNPTLTPAATIPRDLQQFYTGIATAAPSASAINAAAGGGALVPFSDILTASGLGQVFGLLVGLCCAGWVLTRGRSG